ncbi:hypothetical protein AAHN93_11020 [Vandammella animalimorsus]|uniref:hypothetical protein n=1 Tax=Vandammella animalimorsus TaxID=2029117 RepID=UPI0031BAFD9F
MPMLSGASNRFALSTKMRVIALTGHAPYIAFDALCIEGFPGHSLQCVAEAAWGKTA